MPTIVDAAVLAGSAAGWTPTYTEDVAVEYRRFVELASQHPGAALVPALHVDLVWHECIDLGVDGTPRHAQSRNVMESTVVQTSAGEWTVALYRERFGEPPSMWTTSAGCQIDAPDGDEPPPAE